MKSKYRALFVLALLLITLPCAAFALGSLTIDGSAYDSAALTGPLSGADWTWSASANSGQGELTLNGYSGERIAATDGVLYMHLIGENTIITNQLAALAVSGSNTGLALYGGDPAADTLTVCSTVVTGNLNNPCSAINITISNSATIPFSFSNIGFVVDYSQVTTTGYAMGINIKHSTNSASLFAIDMEMDNAVITMSNENNHVTFAYGMWASPNRGSIRAVFNHCTFNLSNFAYRGWYTGRDLAFSSSATYNNCVFNLHSTISSSLGLHISSDADVGFGTSKMTLNNPDGEIEVGGTAALFVRSANPILTINGSDIQAWGPDGTELVNPHNVYLYPLQTRTTIIAQTLGLTDMDFVSHDYEDLATHIIFTPRPVQPPQTGDTSTPMLYVLLLLLAAAGIAALRVRAVKR